MVTSSIIVGETVNPPESSTRFTCDAKIRKNAPVFCGDEHCIIYYTRTLPYVIPERSTTDSMACWILDLNL